MIDNELFYDKHCLEEMHYYMTVNDVVDLIETHGYSKVLHDIAVTKGQRNFERSVDNTNKQE